jgi:serine O-acetyltransferase
MNLIKNFIPKFVYLKGFIILWVRLMIKTYAQYLKFLEADRVSLGIEKTLMNYLFNDIWRFQKTMRKLEFLTNCKKNRFYRAYIAYRYKMQGRKLGYSIPINTFGPGLSIAHRGTLVVNAGAKVGANCRIHVCVNIGTEAGKSDYAPTIGDNCYIGPGVKMFGKIQLGSNMSIGANAVVNRSFPEGNATIGGIPAKIISDKTSEGLLIKGYKG